MSQNQQAERTAGDDSADGLGRNLTKLQGVKKEVSKRRAQASVKRVKGDWCKTNLSEGDAEKLAIQLSEAGGRMKGRGEGGGGGGKHQQPESRKVSHPVTSPLIGIAVHRDQPIPKDTGT